ncbi:MAG: hypothetical protein AB8V23_01260 [Candidatus Midichloria sp.]|uniref:Uncharacterized protein n=1 Tax=Hyalomma marginatum TaxID=34627 RepID=A0A8S4BX70_9ACAR|nr:hypothetical protein MHYMCMPSP_00503 [Hyalomma marginatum]CAG7599152.1 hypothetical protein MHYMCMPASI_01072 [Hyalomma marginatum]
MVYVVYEIGDVGVSSVASADVNDGWPGRDVIIGSPIGSDYL